MRGFEVLEASDGTEALSILEQRNDDIVGFVTDVVMPKMDGPTWVEQGLILRPDTPVLFNSGYAEESFIDRIEQLGNFRVIAKPFSAQKLSEEVVRMVFGV
jgi:two-component system cell cycle sensor histidine kinase/response regulator CckA